MKYLYTKAVLLFTTVLLLNACKSSPDIVEPELFTPEFLDPASFKQKEPTSVGDEEWNVLGYGYDVTGVYADAKSVRRKIINVEKYHAEAPTRVVMHLGRSGEFKLITGATAEELSSAYSSRLETLDEYKGFKGTFGQFNTSDSPFSSKYVYANVSSQSYLKRVGLLTTHPMMHYLEPSFTEDVALLSAQELVRYYGTHVLTDVALGASLHIFYQSQTRELDRNEAALNGAGLAAVQLFGEQSSFNESIVEKNFNQKLYFTMRGGSPDLRKLGLINLETSTVKFDLSDWRASVNEANAEMIDINKAVPIYELIDNPAKKEAVKNYVNAYLAQNAVKDVYETGPVHMYFNKQYTNHFYTITPTDLAGYTYHGVEFKAFLGPAPGAVPVLRYYHPEKVSHFYKASPGLEGFDAYKYDGVEFYAYPADISPLNSIPVYHYADNKRASHYFSRTASNPSGYKLSGVAFHAFQP